MQELKRYTGISTAALLVSVLLLFLFPRETHAVIATVLAILFWAALLVTGFFTYSLIHNIRVRKKRGARAVMTAQRKTRDLGARSQRRRRKERTIKRKKYNLEETEDESY